jgi:exopolysaccharide production protein ExoQ
MARGRRCGGCMARYNHFRAAYTAMTPFASQPDDHDAVWLMQPTFAPPHLPAVDATLVTIVLVVLCGNLPAVLMHHLAGLRGVPVWPLYMLLYGAIGVLLMARVAFATRLLGLALPILAMSLLPLVSAGWSVTPLETAVQALTLAGTAVTGFYLAAGVPVRQALRVLAMAATTAAALDLAAIVALPSVGIEQDGPWVGTWRGLHDQKNGLGAYAALQLLLLVACVRSEKQIAAFAMVGIALNLFLLITAKSTTSWLTAAACLPIVMAPRPLLWLIGRALPAGMALLVLWILLDPDVAVGLLQALPGLVGKDSTLSNRLPVWEVLAPYLEAAPWVGYGYGAFWSEAFMPGEVFLAQIRFLPGSAHSSIFEIRLSLGFVGLALMAAVTLHFIVCLWSCDHPRTTGDAADLAPLAHAVLAFVLFQSLTESVLLTRNDLMWALLVWLAARLALAARDRAHSIRPIRLEVRQS